MNNFAPSLSIIIPAHNESSAITKTLVSIIDNRINYPYEIIVACNGCTDDTAEIAGNYPVQVIESEKSGMSFGKNLGAAAAKNDFFIFVDADTTLKTGSINRYINQIARKAPDPNRIIGTVAGAPEKGGLVVRSCFHIANIVTSHSRVHAPGGVMLMNRSVYEDINGFDENLPQGTSTDLIMRAISAGANYICFHSPRAITSIRRFEKRGIVSQMLDWRRNHQHMRDNEHDKLAKKNYKVIR